MRFLEFRNLGTNSVTDRKAIPCQKQFIGHSRLFKYVHDGKNNSCLIYLNFEI